MYIINSIPVITHPDDGHKIDRNMLVKNNNTWPNIFTNCSLNQTSTQHSVTHAHRHTRTATSPPVDSCCHQVPPQTFSKLRVIFEKPSRHSRHQVLVRLMFCALTLTNMTPRAGWMYKSSCCLTSVVNFMKSIRTCPAVAEQQTDMSAVAAGRGQQRTPIWRTWCQTGARGWLPAL